MFGDEDAVSRPLELHPCLIDVVSRLPVRELDDDRPYLVLLVSLQAVRNRDILRQDLDSQGSIEKL